MVAAQGGHMDILDLLIGLAEGKEALSTMLVAVDPEGEQVRCPLSCSCNVSIMRPEDKALMQHGRMIDAASLLYTGRGPSDPAALSAIPNC